MRDCLGPENSINALKVLTSVGCTQLVRAAAANKVSLKRLEKVKFSIICLR